MKRFATALSLFALLALLGTSPVAAQADFCDSPTSCTFQGLRNFALGDAQLSVSKNGLLVDNLGSSGTDGVRIENPEFTNSLQAPPTSQGQGGEVIDLGPVVTIDPRPFTGHEEWVELGFVMWESGLNPSDGSFLDFVAEAQMVGIAGVRNANLHIEAAGGLAVITTDFSDINATQLEYRVFNGGVLDGTACTAQPLGSVVTSPTWPVSMAFSEVNWDVVATITLPCGPRTGDTLEIEPINAADVAKPIRVNTLVRTLPPSSAPAGRGAALAPNLMNLLITEERYPNFFSGSIPMFGTLGTVLFATLLVLGGGWILRRRI